MEAGPGRAADYALWLRSLKLVAPLGLLSLRKATKINVKNEKERVVLSPSRESADTGFWLGCGPLPPPASFAFLFFLFALAMHTLSTVSSALYS